MIRNVDRFIELREAEDLARDRAMTTEEAVALGEDLLRSDLMRFVKPDDRRPCSLAIALAPKRRRVAPA